MMVEWIERQHWPWALKAEAKASLESEGDHRTTTEWHQWAAHRGVARPDL